MPKWNRSVTEADVFEALNVLCSDRLRTVELAVLFRGLRGLCPALTIGQFHDLLRVMWRGGMVRLFPFTQAMYQLRDGEFCMIVGHEIMAYVEPVLSTKGNKP